MILKYIKFQPKIKIDFIKKRLICKYIIKIQEYKTQINYLYRINMYL